LATASRPRAATPASTAELLSPVLGDLTIATDARLTEYDFGAWDGSTPAELRARGCWQAVENDPEVTPPRGEPFADSARRVTAALQEIAALHPGARVVVIGHGLTLAAALAPLLDRDPRHAPRYALDNAGTAELALNGQPKPIHLDPIVS
jgi:broad specificity phosphatase PhoE